MTPETTALKAAWKDAQIAADVAKATYFDAVYAENIRWDGNSAVWTGGTGVYDEISGSVKMSEGTWLAHTYGYKGTSSSGTGMGFSTRTEAVNAVNGWMADFAVRYTDRGLL